MTRIIGSMEKKHLTETKSLIWLAEQTEDYGSPFIRSLPTEGGNACYLTTYNKDPIAKWGR